MQYLQKTHVLLACGELTACAACSRVCRKQRCYAHHARAKKTKNHQRVRELQSLSFPSEVIQADPHPPANLEEASSVAASGQLQPAINQESRNEGKDLEKIPVELNVNVLKKMRSSEPLWKMANKFVEGRHNHFDEPSKDLNQLHRPMIGNMSYFEGDGLKMAIMARILMTLMTVEPKQKKVFGPAQIPKEHGGGPFYAAARACVKPADVRPDAKLRHKEVIIKGLTQLSKTPETICQAFVCFFAEGVLPSIMVRNRGGANVGTADMRDAVLEMNADIKRIFNEIAHLYSHRQEFQMINDTDFCLTPRCTSAQGKAAEWLDIHGGAPMNYKLKYPQVLISCTNVTAINRMTETIKGKGIGANMRMSLIEWASGYRRPGDRHDANPHVPFIWDLTNINKAPQSAIALLFDEDDANRSSTGNQKTDKLLFEICPKLQHMAEDMIKRRETERDEWGESDDEGNAVDEEEDERVREETNFYRQFSKRSVRSRVARVFAYTATPSTVLHDLGDKASQIDSHIIELNPGENYVGYMTERSKDKWPWLKKSIEVVTMPNRVQPETYSLTSLYPHFMRKFYDFSFQEGDEMPWPFKTSANGTISLPKRLEDEEMELFDRDNTTAEGEIPKMIQTAGWLRDKVKKAKTKSSERMDKFWRNDGVNLVHVLRDMHEKQEDYPQGYRNLLYMTNFSRQEKVQSNVVDLVLSFADVNNGRDEALVMDLICVEYTYKHVRFSWIAGNGVDGGCLLESCKALMDEPDDFNDSIGFSFGKTAAMSDDVEDGQIQQLESEVPNINWAYSALWKYKTSMKKSNPAFFLKVMVVAGEIGSRGVRYKAAKTHQFCLTDMFHAFDVSSTTQICAHGAGTLQSIGRLCSMVKNISECPKIKLWMPEDCWKMTNLWLEANDCLPDLLEKKRQLEEDKGAGMTMRQLLKHVTQDEAIARDFSPMRKLLTGATGHNKRGAALYARDNHMITPCKNRAESLAKDPACLPSDPIEVDKDKDKRRAEMAEHLVHEAIKDDGEGDVDASSDVSEEGPCPPVARGKQSYPQPKKKVVRPAHNRHGTSAFPRAETDKFGLKYELTSPISSDVMKRHESKIEYYAYHDKELWSFEARILRRVLYDRAQQHYENRDDDAENQDGDMCLGTEEVTKLKLLQGHFSLEKDSETGKPTVRAIEQEKFAHYVQVETSLEKWLALKLGTKSDGNKQLPIFVQAECTVGDPVRQLRPLKVNPEIVDFARRFCEEIASSSGGKPKDSKKEAETFVKKQLERCAARCLQRLDEASRSAKKRPCESESAGIKDGSDFGGRDGGMQNGANRSGTKRSRNSGGGGGGDDDRGAVASSHADMEMGSPASAGTSSCPPGMAFGYGGPVSTSSHPGRGEGASAGSS